MTGQVAVECEDAICTLELVNEGRRNALTPGMLETLADTLDSLADRDDVRCVVVTGRGEDAFCAGFDISGDFSPDEHQNVLDRAMRGLAEFPYPTVGMANGHAVGGGFELLASCDLRYAVADARFGVPAAKIGVVYGPRGVKRFLDVLGPTDAKELLFTGDLVDADRAREMGLLNDVLPDHYALTERTDETAATIASNAPLSLTGMKTILHDLVEKRSLTEEEAARAERLEREAYESRDHAEGLRAFAEGRDPDFDGR